MKPAAKPGLDDYIETLSGAFNVDVCLYDIHSFTDDQELRVSRKQRIHNCPCCLAMKRSRAGLSDCILQEHRMLQEVPPDAPWQLRLCRMGVAQLVLPLRPEGKLIGGIFWGMRFLSGRRPGGAALRKLAATYGLDPLELEEMARHTPEISRRKLLDSAPAAMLLRDYILAVRRNRQLRRRLDPRSPPQTRPGVPLVPEMDLAAILPPGLAGRETLSPEMGKVVEFIHRSYWKNISRETVAELASLSPSHFSRRFQSELGCSFRGYLQQCQIAAAAYLLKHSDASVEHIAFKLGFSSGAAFNRSFKSLTGFSPRRFTISNAAYPWSDH